MNIKYIVFISLIPMSCYGSITEYDLVKAIDNQDVEAVKNILDQQPQLAEYIKKSTYMSPHTQEQYEIYTPLPLYVIEKMWIRDSEQPDFKNLMTILQIIIDNGASLKETNELGYTPLQKATERKLVPIIQLLLNNHADINQTTSITSYKPINYSREYSEYERPKKKIINSMTALHLAVMHDYPEIVQFLLEHGAASTIKNSKGLSPYDLAEKLNKKEILDIFDKHKLLSMFRQGFTKVYTRPKDIKNIKCAFK